MTDILLLVADLQRDEGWRGYLYDDATAAPIKTGSLIRGHPTIGYGFALDVAPLTENEALPILKSRAASAANNIQAVLPWFSSQTEPRQRALANMAYNLGVQALLKFETFLSLMKSGHYEEAADDLETTAWFRQVGSRGPRIQALIRGAES